MFAMALALAVTGQTAAPAARPRVIVSTVAPARPAARTAERRPRVNWELTDHAGDPSREMPFALDEPPAPDPAAQVAPHAPPLPSPQAAVTTQAAPQVVVSCPCQTAPATFAAPVTMGPQNFVPAWPARPTVRYIEAETYSQPVTYSYSQPFTYMDRPSVVYESAPLSASLSALPMATRQSAGFTAPYGGGYDFGAPASYAAPQAQADGMRPIYIDARQTMEHGPRFGIGAGLFRSGNTNRVGNGRGGGLFGRRDRFSGTAYDGGAATFAAPLVCGPNGCSY